MILLSLGLLVLLGFAASRLLKRIGLPAVTGYLIAGIIIGPSMLHLVGADAIAALKPLGAFCLATIFFMLGEEFRLHELAKLGKRFLSLTVVQSVVTMVCVTVLVRLCGAPIEVALLLGAIAGTTDPAATVSVIRELRGKGELVQTLLAVVALNGLVEIALFSTLMAVVAMIRTGGIDPVMLLQGPLLEVGGSLALGLALGWALRAWSRSSFGRASSGRESLKIPTLSLILLGAGLSEAAHLSVLLSMMSFGAVVANTHPFKAQVFDHGRAMEGPLLVMFFTLSGATLHLAELGALGWLGLAYIGGRLIGKIAGGSLGAWVAGASPSTVRHLGFGLVPQASMAIGLAAVVEAKFPDVAGSLMPITLGAIVVFETLGPLLTRHALLRSGEGNPDHAGERTWLPTPRSAP
jgi:Kef-type K+ transport system membrane component KefB